VCSFFLNSAVYEIMWKNIIKRGMTQMTVWGMCIACWIPKATNTHSNYVIFIAFLMQQWLHEHASMLRVTYIAYLVFHLFSHMTWKQSRTTIQHLFLKSTWIPLSDAGSSQEWVCFTTPTFLFPSVTSTGIFLYVTVVILFRMICGRSLPLVRIAKVVHHSIL